MVLFPFIGDCSGRTYLIKRAPIKAPMARASINTRQRSGKVSIFLRINHGDGKRKLISLGISVPQSQWNDKTKQVRKAHRSSSSLNRRISECLSIADEVIDDKVSKRHPVTLEGITADVRARLFDEPVVKQEGDFLAFCDGLLVEYEGRGQVATFNAYRTAVNKLRAYTRKTTRLNVLSFTALTPAFIRSFHTHMVKDLGNATNTVHKNLTSIRTMVYRAISDGLMSRNDDPFFGMKIKKEKTMRGRITAGEFVAIEQVELIDEGAQHTRREFLFAYYAGGMRYSDVCLLKWSHVRYDGKEYRIRFKMKKVADGAGVVIVPKAMRIIEHYGEPGELAGQDVYVFMPLRARRVTPTPRGIHNAISSATTVANRNLKKIAKAAGITTRLTTHMARHSIAKLLDDEGWDIYDIMKILGHTQVTTTQNYLAGFQSTRLDGEFRGVFGDD